jgi:NADH-quinone oxidoreductase subunit G
MPMLAHRIRKAAVTRGAQVAFLNPRRFEFMFPVAGYAVHSDMAGELTALVHAAAGAAGKPVPKGVGTATVTDAHRSLIAALSHGTRRAVILGTLAQRHPAYAQLKALSAILADLCAASIGGITEGANAAGAYLAGAVPHREPGGAAAGSNGLSARQMLTEPLKAYVLFGGIDPANDLSEDAAALASADLVIAMTTHLPDSLRGVAHVVLPIGCFAETSGTYVSAEGRWQSWAGAAKLPGESRPGWKVLRVLANLLNLHGIDYDSSDQIRDALKTLCGARVEAEPMAGAAMPNGQIPSGPWMDIPPYQSDVLVRGSEPLQKTKDGRMTRSVI